MSSLRLPYPPSCMILRYMCSHFHSDKWHYVTFGAIQVGGINGFPASLSTCVVHVVVSR